MSRCRPLTVVVALLFCGTSLVLAQVPVPERLLIPVDVEGAVPGAYGSLWTSLLFARNNSNVPIPVEGVLHDCLGVPLCPPRPGIVPPGKSVTLVPTGVSDRVGVVLHIEQERLRDLTLSLRLRDISREHLTWGTEIPVVPEREFRSDAITLVGIPVSPDFRTTLRVYEITGSESVSVRVRLFGIVSNKVGVERMDPPADELLAEHIFTLRPSLERERGRSPGYLELSDVSSMAGIHDYQLLTIQVVPMTPVSLWSFASVTNNVTQHVTIITPD